MIDQKFEIIALNSSQIVLIGIQKYRKYIFIVFIVLSSKHMKLKYL